MESGNKPQVGPALAIIIIIGVVALSGVLFYKSMVKDMFYEEGSQVNVPGEYYDKLKEMAMMKEEEAKANTENADLSESVDLDAIEEDLNATNEEALADAFDELDAQLLDFEDLEDFDLNF